jgi:Fic-DOC domain mobile mystery protein B
VGLDIDATSGQTPLDEDEREALLIPTITTRGELDEFEQIGLEQAATWTLKTKPDQDRILTEEFVLELHRRMFADIWRWAGSYRTTNKNLGADSAQIRVEVRKLLDDCRYWVTHGVFGEDEIAVRLSHRIVSIHPFPNGNGRHSRMLADTLLRFGFGKSPFSWGSASLKPPGAARSAYLTALREADRNDYRALLAFARA